MRVTVFGTRGSVPVSGSKYAIFGGHTSCYAVQASDKTFILDAGSGLVTAPDEHGCTPIILLSHMHVDHLLGLGMFGGVSKPGQTTKIFVPACNDVEARMAIDRLYSPPLWPLPLSDYSGDLQIGTMQETMRFGDVLVETEQGNHPGGCLLIKISFGQKTLVYASDFEHGEEASERLTKFAHNVDLLLYDGQYSVEEYESHRGFGHSTPAAGVELKDRCGARQLLIVHHDPHSIDSVLLARERDLGRDDVRFAREGEVIEL